MQGSFEDIYNRLQPIISKDDLNTISDLDYDEIIELNDDSDNNDNNTINKNIIVFNIIPYLNRIYDSLNNGNKITDQFSLDFYRSELYFNKKYIRNIEYFLKYIKQKYNKETNYNNMTLDSIIKMLCNQSAFAFPFTIMNKIYGRPDKGIYVTSNSIQYFIYDNKDKNITFELVGTFNIKNIHINKVIFSVKTTVKIDITYDNKEGLYNFQKLGLVSW